MGYPSYPPGSPSPRYSPVPGAQKTNRLAIASLVLSLAGLLCGIGPVLGVILGFVARGQIRRSNGAQTGNRLALAGIIVGFVFIGMIIIGIVAAMGLGPSTGKS